MRDMYDKSQIRVEDAGRGATKITAMMVRRRIVGDIKTPGAPMGLFWGGD